MILLGIRLFVVAWLLSGRHGFINGLLRLALAKHVVWYVAIKFSKPFGTVISNFVDGQFIRTSVPQI